MNDKVNPLKTPEDIAVLLENTLDENPLIEVTNISTLSNAIMIKTTNGYGFILEISEINLLMHDMIHRQCPACRHKANAVNFHYTQDPPDQLDTEPTGLCPECNRSGKANPFL